MATIKSIAKILLFISIVLALGQITIANETVGSKFVQGVKNSTVWTVTQIAESKMMAGVPLPDFMKDLVSAKEAKESKEPKEKIQKSKRVSEIEGEMSRSDRQQVLKLLGK